MATQIKSSDIIKSLSNDNYGDKVIIEKRRRKKNVKNEEEKIITEQEQTIIPKSESVNNIDNTQDNKEIFRKQCLDLFGKGFSDEDYDELYSKFSKLSNNYPLRTAFHTEALATYVKYAYRRDVAIADGDAESAKTWGQLAKDQADKAKINPNQLSAADLSDGMTCFSQLSALVEKAQDIVPILPEFIEEPKDRVDYTIWEYVNYINHLLGKPLIEYRKLYDFLNARYESLKKRYKFMKKEDYGDFDNNDVDSED